MINKIDKLIIDILLKVCEVLTNYSKKISHYDLYEIKTSIKELDSHIEEDVEVEENGD